MNTFDNEPSPELLQVLAKRCGGTVTRIKKGGGTLGWQLRVPGALLNTTRKDLKAAGYHYAGTSWVRWDE